MRVVLPLTGKSYLPEVPAYDDAFTEAGHEVLITEPGEDIRSLRPDDVVFRFGGLLTYIRGLSAIEVHEYASASTTRFPKLKDAVKSLIATKPAGRVFVTDWVSRQFNFRHKAPSVVRSQGADASFLSARHTSERSYDIVFAGSLSGRSGLLDAFEKCSAARCSIAVAGTGSPLDIDRIRSISGVDYFGLLGRSELAEFFGLGRFALNFCPNVYPFNQQPATKVIEYLVAGRPIISNRYPWIDSHSRASGYEYYPLDALCDADELEPSSRAVLPEIIAKTHTFPEVLQRAGVVPFVEQLWRDAVSCR